MITMKEIIIDGVTYILTPKEEKKEHEYVDLGLPSGRLWATCNIGADKPTDSGDYFAWGATEPYKLGEYDTRNYAKSESSKIQEIDDAHDAATVLWGNEWRMPTLTDFAELIDHTDFEYIENVDKDGLNYVRYTSKINGNMLIFPYAGYVNGSSLILRRAFGHFWSRSRYSAANAWFLNIYSGGAGIYNINRLFGFSVRPVRR